MVHPEAWVIRDARAEDAPVLAAAEREIARVPGRLASRPHELVDEAFREKIEALSQSDRGRYVVMESEGAIVGHAFLDPSRLAATSHVVDLTIAIHEGHQGRGLGRALLAHLVDWARAHPGIEKITLHVRSSNRAALSLYEHMGFQVEGVRVRQIKLGPDSYLDNVAMALWVGP